ncbi:DUF72 domain-containing protein [Shinella curvata]|uniref:DUF72 domain-containing protein n=1 Tax=Shinella curvata TaxID=1817964 RepID=A0ABT8XN12_9HYPH|nr:DUF72 domain-containing protein [Shinella curvata]MCJ8056166.1 DUF72 domain-containing protein [Shinella curvata]MDO6125131.1 DUF72 domain-containing protein [Shinella curvata]
MWKTGPCIATAAWSIPKKVARRFPETGSSLERYAAVFNGVEINSTFYRHHQKATFQRWANAVPAHFKFAVKIPREITHEARLRNIGPLFGVFLDEVSMLEDKLGPLLCQLPPSLGFDADEVEKAFSAMRRTFPGTLVIEPRHRSWASPPALTLLQEYVIDRVLADPAPVWPLSDFRETPRYVRLHGTPKIYYSSYSEAEIRGFAEHLGTESWCVFDNTASGAAIENALAMQDHMTDKQDG